MNEPSCESDLRELLFERSRDFRADVPPAPTENRWWLASALQKAIRRGYADLAMQYAAGLLEHHSGYVFRRLAVIALEDAGPAAWTACRLVLEAARSRTFVRKLGEKRVLLCLVYELANSPKSRSLADAGNLIDGKPTEDWQDRVNELPWLLQSIALRGKSLEGLVSGLPTVYEMSRRERSVIEYPPDEPGDVMIGGLLAASFDKHVYEGLEAIRTLAGTYTPKQLGLALFYLEGCAVDRELHFAGSRRLKTESHELDYLTRYGFKSREHVLECRDYLHRNRDLLSDARRKALGRSVRHIS